MANEYDLWQAIVAIVEADTGAGNMAGTGSLTGKDNPLVRIGTRGTFTRPIVMGELLPYRYLGPTEDEFVVPARLHCLTAGGAGGLEVRMCDRLEVILTNAAFTAEGLDVAPFLRGRRPLSELDEGGQRLVLEVDFLLTR